jgi:hypothetical protein
VTPQERYERDPVFCALVDSLFVQIRDARYTPTEIREAAMLAQIRYESLCPRPVVYVPSAEPRERVRYRLMVFCEHANEAPRGGHCTCPFDCGCRETMCRVLNEKDSWL